MQGEEERQKHPIQITLQQLSEEEVLAKAGGQMSIV